MPNSFDPGQGLRRYYDPVRINIKDGQLKKKRVGYIPAPFTVEELQRLLLVYYFGDTAATSALHYYPAKVDDVDYPGADVISANPGDDDIIHRVRAKMTDIVFATEIIGGVFFFDEACPDIELISVTAARILEAGQDPDNFIDFCLPAIPEGETEQETADRLELEGLQRWIVAHISPDQLDKIIADWFNRHGGNTQTGGPYGPGNGQPPGTGDGSVNNGGTGGGNDTGVGGSDWTTATNGVIVACLVPPLLVDGPHFEDAALGIITGGIATFNHSVDITDKVKDAYYRLFGRAGKLYRFCWLKTAFDGIALNTLHFHHPVDISYSPIGTIEPFMKVGITDPDFAPATKNPVNGHIDINLDGVQIALADIDAREYADSPAIHGSVSEYLPNTGTWPQCADIHVGYSLVGPPVGTVFDEGELVKDHTGQRFFLECLGMWPAPLDEVTLPFEQDARVDDNSATTMLDASIHRNGWPESFDYWCPEGVWRCDIFPRIKHFNCFIPEGATATKIIFTAHHNGYPVTSANPYPFVYIVEDGRPTEPEGVIGQVTNYYGNSLTDGCGETNSDTVEVTLTHEIDSCYPIICSVYGPAFCSYIKLDYA